MNDPITIGMTDHPLLYPLGFVSDFSDGVGDSPDWLIELLTLDSPDGPADHDDAVRQAIRSMLRTHGYKPSGRGKPASEYLLRAAGDGALGSINLPVDLCNATSLHWQLPISVIDLGGASPPFRIGVADAGESYVFNASGQEIKLDGLPCLFDADGPCANAVRDSQRTKTSGSTRRTLSIIWGSVELVDHCESAYRWYCGLTTRSGAEVTDVVLGT